MWDATLEKAKYGIIPRQAAKLWDADEDSVKLIYAGMSLVFKMKCHGKIRYLRITHPLIRSQRELLAAIDYQRYLFETDVPICQPLKSKRNQYIEEVPHFDTTYLAYVNDAVPGEVIHAANNEKQVYETWGKSLAHLHRAAKNYASEDMHQFLSWQDLWEEAGRIAAHEDNVIQQEYNRISEWFGQLSVDKHDFGLTHGDYRVENVLYDGHKVSIVAMDEPVYHWFLADIVRPFLDIMVEEKWREKLMLFLDGYYTIMPYVEDKMDDLLWFMRMKNMDLYLWQKNNVGIRDNVFKNVQLVELREKIENCRLG